MGEEECQLIKNSFADILSGRGPGKREDELYIVLWNYVRGRKHVTLEDVRDVVREEVVGAMYERASEPIAKTATKQRLAVAAVSSIAFGIAAYTTQMSLRDIIGEVSPEACIGIGSAIAVLLGSLTGRSLAAKVDAKYEELSQRCEKIYDSLPNPEFKRILNQSLRDLS